MPREFSRTRRIGEQMQRELALIIQQEIRDPRLGLATIAGVEVSRDLSHARVFVSLLGEGEPEVRLGVLRRASGFLRHELGRRMLLRTVPELRFIHDTTSERGSRLSALIDEAVARDKEQNEE